VSEDLKLYKALEEYAFEYHFIDEDEKIFGAWFYYHNLGEFVQTFPHIFETENDVRASLQTTLVFLDLTDIFEDIDFTDWSSFE
jgi:hypothetical protein